MMNSARKWKACASSPRRRRNFATRYALLAMLPAWAERMSGQSAKCNVQSSMAASSLAIRGMLRSVGVVALPVVDIIQAHGPAVGRIEARLAEAHEVPVWRMAGGHARQQRLAVGGQPVFGTRALHAIAVHLAVVGQGRGEIHVDSVVIWAPIGHAQAGPGHLESYRLGVHHREIARLPLDGGSPLYRFGVAAAVGAQGEGHIAAESVWAGRQAQINVAD